MGPIMDAFSSRHAGIPNGLARSGKMPETCLPELGETTWLQMQARENKETVEQRVLKLQAHPKSKTMLTIC